MEVICDAFNWMLEDDSILDYFKDNSPWTHYGCNKIKELFKHTYYLNDEYEYIIFLGEHEQCFYYFTPVKLKVLTRDFLTLDLGYKFRKDITKIDLYKLQSV